MYTVLMPIDGSEERAATQAATVADLPGAGEEILVHLLHVFDSHERAAETDLRELPAGERAMARLEAVDVTTKTMSRQGDPAAEILRAADEVDADMILLGGRKRSPLGSAIFGSVSQAVTLESDRPVVVTGDGAAGDVPTHRCQSCGEEFFTESSVEISSCRNCGGTKVERVEEEPTPTA